MNIVKIIIKIILIVLCSCIVLFILDYARINIRYLLQKKYYKEEFSVQGIKDGYVPQGLTYNREHDLVLQTSYNKEHKVSKLYLTNFTDKKFIKELELLDENGNESTSHVGGIATYKDTIYITSDYKIYEYSMDDALTSTNKITATKSGDLTIRGDFCYCDEEKNILWVGDFFLKPVYPVPNDDPKLYGFSLTKENSSYFTEPDYSYSLPKMVQGMAINKNKVFFSESYTYLINSNLEIYDNIIENNNGSKFYKANKVKTIKLPPMSEGIFIKDDRLYFLLESAADSYGGAYPKVYNILSVDINDLIK